MNPVRPVRKVLGALLLLGPLAGPLACGPDDPPPRRADAGRDAPARDADAGGAGPRIVINEILYHPVLDDEGPEERHEFLELHNPGDAPVAVGGWTLAGKGGLSFTLPPDGVLAPGAFLVVAKDPDALRALPGYDLAGVDVVGGYAGSLDNGGDALVLADAAGAAVDRVAYDDGFPWPHAADALGAGAAWLPPALLPLEAHRGRGVSLERIGPTLPGQEVASWAPSALGGATPGRANGAGGAPLAVVEAIAVSAPGGAPQVPPGEEAVVSARFSKQGASGLKDVLVEWFVDDVARADEPVTTTPMSLADGAYRATLPAQAQNSVVRYRIRADRGGGAPDPVSPRPSDPYPFHAYFVAPEAKSASRAHHLFIAPADWARLEANLRKGNLAGCMPLASYDERVPAIFVSEGKVYDVRVRYQGSYEQRMNGGDIAAWPYPGPGVTPLRALSWNVSFPRYRRFGGRGSLVLNKLHYSCPGVEWYVEGALMWSLGIPTTRVRFARLDVNGGYYHYMMEVEALNEDLLASAEGKGKPVGDLFKVDGVFQDRGPWARADGRLLGPACGFSSADRYAVNYQRQTHEWKGPAGHAELVALLEAFQAAKAAGPAALRAHFETHYDVGKLLDVHAVRNWAGVWDDVYHNYYPYKRPGDGKWVILPQDYDLDFNGAEGTDLDWAKRPAATTTFYIGEEGQPLSVNPLGANQIKSAFLKTFRAEYDARLRALAGSTLSPENVLRLIGEFEARFSLADWRESPAAKKCDPAARIAKLRAWVQERHAAVLAGIK